MYAKIIAELKRDSHPEKIGVLKSFFKTGKGEYGEGDKFLGVVVPVQRRIAKKYQQADWLVVGKLLASPYHEYRLTGLLILVCKYQSADERTKQKIFQFYLKSAKFINNWDLVDVTCPAIVGDYLYYHPAGRKVLYKLVKSKNIWVRRIAVLATFVFIRHGDFKDALRLAAALLTDRNDLIHKAVGWMLREVGKRDRRTLDNFLVKNTSKLPRVALRYAIEKHSVVERAKFLAK